MALDEPKDADYTYDVDGFKYIVNKDFMDKVKPIKVDFLNIGFKITAGINFGGGCSGCGSTSDCC
jgi:iron-sulfur cluster assembly protein